MNKLETVKFSNEPSKKEMIKKSNDLIEYCNVCFIAFGSQEKRTYRAKKPIHLDCVKNGLLKGE